MRGGEQARASTRHLHQSLCASNGCMGRRQTARRTRGVTQCKVFSSSPRSGPTGANHSERCGEEARQGVDAFLTEAGPGPGVTHGLKLEGNRGGGILFVYGTQEALCGRRPQPDYSLVWRVRQCRCIHTQNLFPNHWTSPYTCENKTGSQA